MVFIPLQTVIPEELALLDVLHGALNRAWGFHSVAVAGSLLFVIATSLELTKATSTLLGCGIVGMLAGVTLATGVTGFVFSWLRRRSDSLLSR